LLFRVIKREQVGFDRPIYSIELSVGLGLLTSKKLNTLFDDEFQNPKIRLSEFLKIVPNLKKMDMEK